VSTAADRWEEALAPEPDDRWDEVLDIEQATPADPDFQAEVDAEVRRMSIRKEARDAFIRQTEPAAPPFDADLLVDVLLRPVESPFRMDRLMPADGNALLVAQRKVGKTTTLLNAARCLITGEQFLGAFDTLPISGRVAILNYEVSAAQLGRWAADVDVPDDRLLLVNLRGRRNPLQHPDDREVLAEMLRRNDVESLIVDPFGRAFSGKSQNDSGEVGAWLADLDMFARTEAGARDVILTAHAGWDGERSRGASALEDWADSIITMVRRKDKDDQDEGRYLRATGRDVDIAEDLLAFDPRTRKLTLTGAGNRREHAAEQHITGLVDTVVGIVTGQPGINGTEVAKTLRAQGVAFQKGDHSKALEAARATGRIFFQPGPNNAKRYFPNPATPSYPELPHGASPELPQLPLKEWGSSTGNPTAQLPQARLCLIDQCIRSAQAPSQFCDHHPRGATT